MPSFSHYTKGQYDSKPENARSGLQLSKIAHAIVKLEKYTLITDWINANLSEFKELLELEKDTVLEQEEG